MDFIERWLNISPDGGSGASELLLGITLLVTVLSVVLALRQYFPKSLVEFLEQLGKRESTNRFDN